jgi:hypothetical protein
MLCSSRQEQQETQRHADTNAGRHQVVLGLQSCLGLSNWLQIHPIYWHVGRSMIGCLYCAYLRRVLSACVVMMSAVCVRSMQPPHVPALPAALTPATASSSSMSCARCGLCCCVPVCQSCRQAGRPQKAACSTYTSLAYSTKTNMKHLAYSSLHYSQSQQHPTRAQASILCNPPAYSRWCSYSP